MKSKGYIISLFIFTASIFIYLVIEIISSFAGYSYAAPALASSSTATASSSEPAQISEYEVVSGQRRMQGHSFSMTEEDLVNQKINITARVRYDERLLGARPEVYVYLEKNGEVEGQTVVLNGIDTEYSWRDLPKYEFVRIVPMQGGGIRKEYRLNGWSLRAAVSYGFVVNVDDSRELQEDGGEILIRISKDDSIQTTPSEPENPVPSQPDNNLPQSTNSSAQEKANSDKDKNKNKDNKLKADISILNKEDLEKAGAVLNYEIKIENSSNEELKGIWLREYMPRYTNFKAGDGYGKYGYINSREHMTWFIEKLGAKSELVLKFSVKTDYCIGGEIEPELYYEITDTDTSPYFNTSKNPKNKL